MIKIFLLRLTVYFKVEKKLLKNKIFQKFLKEYKKKLANKKKLE